MNTPRFSSGRGTDRTDFAPLPSVASTALAAFLAFLIIVGLASCSQFTLTQNGSNQPVALIYGVSRYLPSWPAGASPNLIAPALDATSMDSLFKSKGWQTIRRLDTTASVDTLASDIADLAGTVAPGQRVLFYWSGHGLRANPDTPSQTEYLALFGAINPATFAFQDSALISTSRLATLFQPLLDKGACLIFVFDSCYSGGFITNGTFSSDLPDNYDTSGKWGTSSAFTNAFVQSLNKYFSNSAAASGLVNPPVWTLAAAGRSEESWEDYLTYNHGIFTYFFLEAGADSGNSLSYGDLNSDGHLTLQEAFMYSSKQIETQWNQYWANADLGKNLKSYDLQFKPHLSGNPLDILLF